MFPSLLFSALSALSVCVCVNQNEIGWISSHSFGHMIEMMPSYGRINKRVYVCVSVSHIYVERNSIVVILTSFNCDCHRFDNSCLIFFHFFYMLFFTSQFRFFLIWFHVWKKNFRCVFLTENGNEIMSFGYSVQHFMCATMRTFLVVIISFRTSLS